MLEYEAFSRYCESLPLEKGFKLWNAYVKCWLDNTDWNGQFKHWNHYMNGEGDKLMSLANIISSEFYCRGNEELFEYNEDL